MKKIEIEIGIAFLLLIQVGCNQKIDRFELVARHHVVLDNYEYRQALQVGNGQIAFAVDVSGLQSFDYLLDIYSEWGWHSFLKPGNVHYDNVLSKFDF